jgi:hypothetical protein
MALAKLGFLNFIVGRFDTGCFGDSPSSWLKCITFGSEHEFWVHLVVKSFSSLPSATEKLHWKKCTIHCCSCVTGSALARKNDQLLLTHRPTIAHAPHEQLLVGYRSWAIMLHHFFFFIYCRASLPMRFCDESTLRQVDLAMNRPCYESTLRWIDPAMKWPCDESICNESTCDKSYYIPHKPTQKDECS